MIQYIVRGGGGTFLYGLCTYVPQKEAFTRDHVTDKDPSRLPKLRRCRFTVANRGDNFSPRMPCQWYVRGGGEGKRRILIGQFVPPTPFGMAFGDVLSCHLWFVKLLTNHNCNLIPYYN
jgi:hypothetical protein